MLATSTVVSLAMADSPRADNLRLDKLYRSFIAPCCWSRNLAEHDSEAARDIRTKIDIMVRAGKSDEDIKAALVNTYGKRILALPEGAEGAWLFATPVVALSAGLGFVGWFLSRRMGRWSNEPHGALMELEDGWDAE